MIGTAFFHLTNQCNLNCRHCLFKFHKPETFPTFELESKILFKAFEKLKDLGIKEIHLTGGEILLYPKILELIRHIKSLGLECSISTNAVLLDSQMSNSLLDLGLDQIIFSLDGSKPESHNWIRNSEIYKKVVNNIINFNRIKKVNNYSSITSLVCTIHPEVIKENPQSFCDLFSSLGADIINLEPLILPKNKNGTWKSLEVSPYSIISFLADIQKAAKRYNDTSFYFPPQPLIVEAVGNLAGIQLDQIGYQCKAGIEDIYVSSSMNIYPCVFFENKHNERPVNLFDIEDRDRLKLSSMFNKLIETRRRVNYYSTYIPCSDCEYAGILCLPCPLSSVKKELFVSNLCVCAKKINSSIMK